MGIAVISINKMDFDKAGFKGPVTYSISRGIGTGQFGQAMILVLANPTIESYEDMFTL